MGPALTRSEGAPALTRGEGASALTRGEGAYRIYITSENKIGGGRYADVYKI
jgi:hypothetical protein